MIFKEIRIFGTKPYPCYLEIMTESVAVCLLFSRLIEEYKLRASCSWINIFLCDQKTFAENSHRNFLCHPVGFYYLCDMEKVTANYPQMSDEAKRQFFFDIIQSVIREAGNFFQWDQSILEKVFENMQSAGLRDCHTVGKAKFASGRRFKLSLEIEGDLYEYKFYAVLFDKHNNRAKRRHFASHTTRDRFIYWADLTDWQIISDNAACFNLSMDKKYIFDLPDLNYRAVPAEK